MRIVYKWHYIDNIN